MAIIQKIFAYNTGSLISGTTQVGDIAISEADVEYSAEFGGLQWWGGPDETNGYVIAHTDPSGTHNGEPGIPAYLGFWRSNGLTDSDFLDLCNSIPPRIGFPPFTSTSDAYTWLNDNGYWTSFISLTPTPTATQAAVTPTPTSSQTPTPSVTHTQTPSVTPTLTPTTTSTPTPTPTSGATGPFSVQFYESGSDVILSYAGTLDLTGLDFSGTTDAGSGGVGAAQALFGIGPTGAIIVDAYTGATFTYPSNFGPGGGGPSGPPTGTGDYFGVFQFVYPGGPKAVVVPTGYTSNTYIAGTTTLSGSSFTSLGLSAGTYNYSWGVGSGQSFDVVIGGGGPTPTPTATSVTPTPTPTSGATGDFTVTISQQGPDVVWNGSGSFNLGALSSLGNQDIGSGLQATSAIWAIGPYTAVTQYGGASFTTYPTSFGTAGSYPPPTSSGSTFGILPGGSGRILLVPSGYTSNTVISGTATYAGTTIAGMNLSGGTYTWAWGSGGNASTLVMTITP